MCQKPVRGDVGRRSYGASSECSLLLVTFYLQAKTARNKMSKGDLLRDLVNARLTAAVEEILLLFNKTIAEYEEELSRSREENQRKQLLLDSILSPRIPLVRVNTSPFNGLSLTQESSENLQIKNEPEVPFIKEEEELPCVESATVGVKTEDSTPPQQRRAEHTEDNTQGIQVENYFHINNVEDWLRSLNSAEKLVDEEHCNEVQTRKHKNDVIRGVDGGHDGGQECEETQHKKTCSAKETKMYQCSFCPRRYELKRSLAAHKIVHTREKCLSCPVCKKIFSRSASVIVHMRSHTGEKLFSCTFCEKKFSRRTILRKHQRIHTKERPFACSICKKTFGQSGHLQEHKRMHTGEKPFNCSVCKKAFSRKTHLSRHERVHTGEKPFSCTLCGRTYATKCSLNNHFASTCKLQNQQTS